MQGIGEAVYLQSHPDILLTIPLAQSTLYTTRNQAQNMRGISPTDQERECIMFERRSWEFHTRGLLMRERGVAMHQSESFSDIDHGDVLQNDTAFLS